MILVNFEIKEDDLDDSSSNVLCIQRFVVEVLRGFRVLNPYNFTDLWFVEVSRGF